MFYKIKRMFLYYSRVVAEPLSAQVDASNGSYTPDQVNKLGREIAWDDERQLNKAKLMQEVLHKGSNRPAVYAFPAICYSIGFGLAIYTLLKLFIL